MTQLRKLFVAFFSLIAALNLGARKATAETVMLAIGIAGFFWRRRDIQLFIVLLIITIGTYERVSWPTSLTNPLFLIGITSIAGMLGLMVYWYFWTGTDKVELNRMVDKIHS